MNHTLHWSLRPEGVLFINQSLAAISSDVCVSHTANTGHQRQTCTSVCLVSEQPSLCSVTPLSTLAPLCPHRVVCTCSVLNQCPYPEQLALVYHVGVSRTCWQCATVSYDHVMFPHGSSEECFQTSWSDCKLENSVSSGMCILNDFSKVENSRARSVISPENITGKAPFSFS